MLISFPPLSGRFVIWRADFPLDKNNNAPFVGRGLDPADPVPFFDWYVEWHYFRNNRRKIKTTDI